MGADDGAARDFEASITVYVNARLEARLKGKPETGVTEASIPQANVAQSELAELDVARRDVGYAACRSIHPLEHDTCRATAGP